MYRQLDEVRRRHPPRDFEKEELEVALVDDAKANFKDRRIKDYYEKQNSFVKELVDVISYTSSSRKKRERKNSEDEEAGKDDEWEESEKGDDDEETGMAAFAVNLSFGSNVFLFFLKVVAFALSGSLSVLASLLDSFLDLASGLILFLTMKAVSNASKESFKFPVGKSRLEPLGVMVFAVIMGISMLLLARETVTALIVGILNNDDVSIPTFDAVVISAIVATVVIKAALHVYCSAVAASTGSAAVDTYAEDHRNDVLTNIAGLAGGLIASKFVDAWFVDPGVALLLALFVAYNWLSAAHEQLWLLVGVTASPELLNKLTLMAHNHDSRIEKVDTVRAYHAGAKLFAEVHVVMRPETPLHISHDVGEALEKDIEHYFKDEIERAFVHIDYEWSHMPSDEHTTNPAVIARRASTTTMTSTTKEGAAVPPPSFDGIATKTRTDRAAIVPSDRN